MTPTICPWALRTGAPARADILMTGPGSIADVTLPFNASLTFFCFAMLSPFLEGSCTRAMTTPWLSDMDTESIGASFNIFSMIARTCAVSLASTARATSGLAASMTALAFMSFLDSSSRLCSTSTPERACSLAEESA